MHENQKAERLKRAVQRSVMREIQQDGRPPINLYCTKGTTVEKAMEGQVTVHSVTSLGLGASVLQSVRKLTKGGTHLGGRFEDVGKGGGVAAGGELVQASSSIMGVVVLKTRKPRKKTGPKNKLSTRRKEDGGYSDV